MMLAEFNAAMNDDLNTSKALGVIYELIKKGNEADSIAIASSVQYYCSLLGFAAKKQVSAVPHREVMQILMDVQKKLQGESRNDLLQYLKSDFFDRIITIKHTDQWYTGVVNVLLDLRNRFRKEKNYEFADYIRERLLENNIIIDDQGIDKSTFRTEVR
jgi:cysteinyl-tRNA synthetase